MENPLEMRRSNSHFIPSSKKENDSMTNFVGPKPQKELDNSYPFNMSSDTDHKAHCEQKQETTANCDCGETSSQDDIFVAMQNYYRRRTVQNGRSALDLLKGSVNSEPGGLTQYHEFNNPRRNGENGSEAESPLHFGLHSGIDSLENLHTKSSQDSSAQEENNNSQKNNTRLELNNQVAELLFDAGDRYPIEGLPPEISFRNIKSEIVDDNPTNLPFLEMFSQASAMSNGKGSEEERKNEGYNNKYTKDDFEKFKKLGGGAYACVYLVKRTNSKMYALKRMHKDFLIKERKDYQVFVEKEVLKKLRNSPKSNIVKLYSSFEDNKYIYFLLEYIDGGDFWNYLAKNKKLPKEQIIFFTAQMINILEYIHSCGIAHRDFKPENLLLKTNGHLKCIDFATAKFLDSNKRTVELFSWLQSLSARPHEGLDSESSRLARVTFNGTSFYVSPEVLENKDSGAPADLWALGSIVYLMATGKQAFGAHSNYMVYERIKKFDIEYPNDMDPEVKDLIKKLLVKEPHLRLGAGIKGSNNDYDALKSHSLFKDIDFERVHLMKIPLFYIESTFSKDVSNRNSVRNILDEAPKTRPKAMSTQTTTSMALSTSGKAHRNIIPMNEPPILSDSVKKNLGWFFPMYKQRQLILTATRLLYYDPETDEPLGEIPLLPSTYAVLGSRSKNKFEVKVPNREYIFKEGERPATEWVNAINKTVASLHQKN